MHQTLLEMTQDILSDMDSDEVNSISDTAESMQVARIIRSTYFNIFSKSNLPEHNKLFSITPSGDSTQPVLMVKPTNVLRIDWIKYNKSDDAATDPSYQYVTIIPIQHFMERMHALDLTSDDVDEMTVNGQKFYFRNEKQPDYCMVLDDENIIFDSYDSEEDSTLQESKTVCTGLVVPTFNLADDYTPEIDDNQYPLLMNDAKAWAFYLLKQTVNEKAEREARRQLISLQKNKTLENRSHFDALPYYGRR